jgi:hypothetical protein
LDDPGRVRSQIATVVRRIQRFDFDRNLVRGSDAKSNNSSRSRMLGALFTPARVGVSWPTV